MRPAVALLALAACGQELDGFTRPPVDTHQPTIQDQWVPVSRIDEGVLCFFDEKDRLRLEVAAHDCLPDRCLRGVGGSCAMGLEGSTITVTSELSWEQDESRACSGPCEPPTVTCYLSTPPAGEHTVQLGAQTQALTLPAEGACLSFGAAGTGS